MEYGHLFAHVHALLFLLIVSLHDTMTHCCTSDVVLLSKKINDYDDVHDL